METKLIYNLNYIVTKESNDGQIKIGERLWLEHYKKESENGYFGYEHFTIFTPVRNEDKAFFGMPPVNHTRVFRNEDEMFKALEGIEVKLDIAYANKAMSNYQKKIDKLKRDYNL